MKRTLQQLEEDLIGQCLETFTEEELADSELMAQAEEVMFTCECCGWVCAIEDLVDHNTCQDCTDDQDLY